MQRSSVGVSESYLCHACCSRGIYSSPVWVGAASWMKQASQNHMQMYEAGVAQACAESTPDTERSHTLSSGPAGTLCASMAPLNSSSLPGTFTCIPHHTAVPSTSHSAHVYKNHSNGCTAPG